MNQVIALASGVSPPVTPGVDGVLNWVLACRKQVWGIGQPFCASFAQVSRSVIVRLNTCNRPGAGAGGESLSRAK